MHARLELCGDGTWWRRDITRTVRCQGIVIDRGKTRPISSSNHLCAQLDARPGLLRPLEPRAIAATRETVLAAAPASEASCLPHRVDDDRHGASNKVGTPPSRNIATARSARASCTASRRGHPGPRHVAVPRRAAHPRSGIQRLTGAQLREIIAYARWDRLRELDMGCGDLGPGDAGAQFLLLSTQKVILVRHSRGHVRRCIHPVDQPWTRQSSTGS